MWISYPGVQVNKKTHLQGGAFFCQVPTFRLGHGLDGSGETALVASSGVRVENTLASHGVDHGFSLLEGFLSGRLVAGDDELAHGLDGGAELAALSREVHVAHDHLAGALASLLGIGHFKNSLPIN